MDTKETSLYHIYLITIMVIVGLGLYFLTSALMLRARFRRAYDAQLEAEINKLESEKKRIAEDLHDEISPTLTAIKMKLDILRASSTKDEESIQKCIVYLNTLTEKIRNITVALMPSVIQDKGIAIAIEQYVHNLGYDCTTDIRYTYDPLPSLSLQNSLHIFRIVQEIIHNTCKRANATELEISISNENKMIILSTADNGKGFYYDPSILSTKSYGLSNIHNRVQSLNGTINIDTAPEKGTRFYLELPIS